ELFLSGSTKLLNQVNERFPLGRRQAAGRSLYRPLVDSKDFPDSRRAFRCQRDEPGAPVLGVGGSNDEALSFEPIDCRGDGPAGQVDAAADGVHGLLTTVEEQLKDSKVRGA